MTLKKLVADLDNEQSSQKREKDKKNKQFKKQSNRYL